MADTVTSQIIVNGPRNLVMKFTNESDGTGETGVKKVDAQSTTFAVNGIEPGIHLKIEKIWYDVKGGAVRLEWDATTATDILVLGGFGHHSWIREGGIPNPNNAGATGSILFTTVGFAAASSYTITLEMRKCI